MLSVSLFDESRMGILVTKLDETWDDFDPNRDLEPLNTLAEELIRETRPADARLVWRAWRALGGRVLAAPEDGPTGIFAH